LHSTSRPTAVFVCVRLSSSSFHEWNGLQLHHLRSVLQWIARMNYRNAGRAVDSEDSTSRTVQVRGEFADAEWTGPGFGLSEDMENQCPFLAHDQAASMDADWSRTLRDCFVDCLPNIAWTLRDLLRW
jgi:hypothetical protein